MDGVNMRKGQSSKALTIPPPVMGLNTKDPISGMDQLYAVELENMFPDGGTVSLRNGYIRRNNLSSGVEPVTLMTLNYGSVNALFATMADESVWDLSASGSGTDIDGGVVLALDRACWTQFRDRTFFTSRINTGTGSDVYHWTGTGNIAASGFTGPGGDDKDLCAMASYKNRLYFAQYTAPSIWYGGVEAISGALTEFSLAGVFTKGLTIIAFVGPITRAWGASADHLFCAISDMGEVVVYQGDYPGSSTWGLVGIYYIPRLVSMESCFYVNNSLHVITEMGVVSINDVMAGNVSDSGVFPTISQNVDSQLTVDMLAREGFGAHFAFTRATNAVVYPKGKYLIINTYVSEDVFNEYKQYVMNLQTGAWCIFTHQPGASWIVLLI
jgi:hypothetical protein